jgi:protease-4
VHTAGFILSGKNGFNPSVGTTLGDESVLRDLQDAIDDDDVKAIVLRIDSPGGEVLASDTIGNAVERATEEKPVVVSMVDVAASGGYMMAYRASRIIALPNTITGSIGSFTGKFNLHGLYSKLGLTKEFVTRGSYPLIDSDYSDWSADEESLIVRQHWEDYDAWIDDIAATRKMESAAVDSVARGRVWTGRQALDRKLVDELGDLRHAVEVASTLADLPRDAKPRLVHYPKPMGLLDVIQERSDLLSAAAAHWARGALLPKGSRFSVLDMHIAH